MKNCPVSLLTIIAILCPASAWADVVSVKNRPQQPFQALGIKTGAFLIHPSIAIEEDYNDNIFAEPSNEESDFITAIKPSLEAKSNWSRHALGLKIDGDFGFYADNSDENYEDYALQFSGRYDIAHETYIDAEASYYREHEERSASNDLDGDEPTEIDILRSKISFTRALGRLKLYLHGAVGDLDFKDNNVGATVIDNDFRDRLQKEAGLRLAYDFTPDTGVFIQGIYDDREYDTAGITDRSSDGYRLRAGLTRTLTGKLKGEIYGGYITQDYGAGFEDVDTADFGGSLLWNPSGLTSVIADLDRRVFETTSDGISAFIRTQGGVTLEHAFRENIIAAANAGLALDDYVGDSREDDWIRAGAELGYKPFRGVDTLLRYDYADRDSNLATEDFTNHRLMLRLGYKY